MRFILVSFLLLGSGCSQIGIRVSGTVPLSTKTMDAYRVELGPSDKAPITVKLESAIGNTLRLLVVNSGTTDVTILLDKSSISFAGKTYSVANVVTRALGSSTLNYIVPVQSKTSAKIDLIGVGLSSFAVNSFDLVGELKLSIQTGDGVDTTALPLIGVKGNGSETPSSTYYDERHVVPVGIEHTVLCVLTSPFYGGWCWSYMFMPFPSQEEEARRRAADNIRVRYGVEVYPSSLSTRSDGW